MSNGSFFGHNLTPILDLSYQMGALTVPTFSRLILTTALTLAIIAGATLLVIWPWPAPAVDWQTPLNAALAKKDCDRVSDIIDAATDAGSLEAYDLLARGEALGRCRDSLNLHLPLDLIVRNGNHLRETRRERLFQSRLRGRDLTPLSFWMRQQVQAINFFCRQPYDTDINTDHVAVSKVLPDETGWLLVPHRQRREICTNLVNDLAAMLATNDEPQAKELAMSLAVWPPASGSPGASVVLATLTLKQDFISRPAVRDDPELLHVTRATAWYGLDTAASHGDANAIDLMIALLREGRFIQDAELLFERTQPYFWVVRSRRLGLSASPVHAEIERSLSAEERRRITAEEESNWSRSHRRRPAA
jgi:hypothetical protein